MNRALSALLITPLIGCGGSGKVASLPVADAGFDQVSVVGTEIHLDGSGSSDSADKELTYEWVLLSQPEGSVEELIGNRNIDPKITLDVGGNYLISLVVSNGDRESVPDLVSLRARGGTNRPPLVDVRCQPSQCEVNHGTSTATNTSVDIQLLGRNTTDPDVDILIYTWSQVVTNGSCSSCANAALCDPTVTLPVTWTTATNIEDVAFEAPYAVGDLVFELQVADPEPLTDSECIVVQSTNTLPLSIVTSSAAVAEEGVTFTLNGSVSDDNDSLDRPNLSYTWSPPASGDVIYTPADPTNSDTVTVTVGGTTLPGTTVTFTLTVSDPFDDSDPCGAPPAACGGRTCCGSVDVDITDVDRTTGQACVFNSECTAGLICRVNDTCGP